RSSVRGTLQTVEIHSPAEILKRVNDAVYQDSKISEVFVAISVVLINNKTFEFKYCGAGDTPITIKEKSSNEVKGLTSEGLLIGFSKKVEYSDLSLKLKPGDIVLITTNGIIESRNKDGKQFGKLSLQKFYKPMTLMRILWKN
ncbi:MAG: PP2C family protein-serine/threonine phosphatase, partial [Ignavibacterium sp.]